MTDHEKIYNILVKLDNGETISKKEEDRLSDCTSLDWSYRRYTSVPHSIHRLEHLQSLNLSGLALTELPDDICKLPKLTDLLLRENQLTRLPAAFSLLKALTYLDLAANPWEQLPEQLRELPALTYLNLSDCRFSEMPAWLLDLNMDFRFRDASRGIILINTQSTNPEISIFKQKRESILKYFTRLEEGGEIVRETKVIFLGDGNVGKTYTIDRIKNNGEPLLESHHTDQTKGISIVHKDFEHNGNPVTIHFWDFGGQQIMHSMHRCFLTNNTIYVIVLSGRAEDMERRLTYWMTSLNSFTHGNCPVIVLENCFDVQNINSVNTTQARRRYKNIEHVLSINVKNAPKKEFDNLMATILNLATTESLYGKKIATLWAKTKEKIEKSTIPYIPEDQYGEYFDPSIGKEERRAILEWLTDLGVSFWYQGHEQLISMDAYVILNPEWATNAIYAIITSQDSDLPKKCSNGILSVDQIQTILEDTKFVNPGVHESTPYYTREIGYILALMQRFQIAYAIKTTGEVFIPSLCRKEEPSNIEADMQDADLHFEVRYDYLPSNILHRLMTSRYDELAQGKKWWYSGGIFVSDHYNCHALILQETKDGKDIISIYIHQEDDGEAWRYLLKIRDQIETSNRQLNIRSAENFIIYTEEDQSLSEAISLEDIQSCLDEEWDKYQSRVFRKNIPLSDILKNMTSPGMEKVITKRKLSGIIIEGCYRMQQRSWMHNAIENVRNDYLCDILRSAPIFVLDQTRCGLGKKDSGELDFLIQDLNRRDIAIIEALNLDCIDKKDLQEHINKLVSDERYNVNGLRELYLLVYAEVSDFSAFCDRYEDFITNHAHYPNPRKETKRVKQRSTTISVWKSKHENDVNIHHICVKFSAKKTK